jgi:hypothetical protein
MNVATSESKMTCPSGAPVHPCLFAQSLVFCVMFGRLLVGFVWLNLYITVSWLVDFNVVRVAQYLDFCIITQKSKY